jgi:DNA-directed RNA polymerase subunit RPC12/RpoP
MDLKDAKTETPKCPECGSSKALPICYGFPDPEMLEDALEGKIVLGGCVIGDVEPTWQCAECSHKWGELRIGDLRQ